FRRTISCATSPVTHAMTIGHGGAKRRTEAKNGMKTTEDPTPAREIRGRGRKDESLAMPRTVNATNAFQNRLSESDGTYQSVATNKVHAATATRARSRRKLQRSNCGWLSPITRFLDQLASKNHSKNREGPHVSARFVQSHLRKTTSRLP